VAQVLYPRSRFREKTPDAADFPTPAAKNHSETFEWKKFAQWLLNSLANLQFAFCNAQFAIDSGCCFHRPS
jgi:hypothetical protein